MAAAREAVFIGAPLRVVMDLVRDLSQRHRFLPDGWRVLYDRSSDGVSRLEIEWDVGLGRTGFLFEQHPDGEHRVVEGPPTADNFITVWQAVEYEGQTVVEVETEFTYGSAIGEFFVRRRLRRAYRQMLERLKAVAEAEEE